MAGVAHTLFSGDGAFGPDNSINGLLILDSHSVLDLMSGYYYANVHTSQVPSGEIRGQVESASLFAANLTGDQEVPPVETGASGKAIFALSADATTLYYRLMVSDIPTITASHIHLSPVGQSGGVVFPLYTGSGDFDEDNPVSGALSLTDENIFDLLAGNYYVNVHTTENPSGEIRGQIEPLNPASHYGTMLTGDQEVPPVTTDATGRGYFTLDYGRNTFHYFISVNDIMSVTASHIHLGRLGESGPPVFTLYTGEGNFDPDHPIGDGAMLNGENLVDLLTGYYYVNVHTTAVPSGEIRGQIDEVPHLIYLPSIRKN